MAEERSFDTNVTLANLFITICMNKQGKAAIVVEGEICILNWISWNVTTENVERNVMCFEEKSTIKGRFPFIHYWPAFHTFPR